MGAFHFVWGAPVARGSGEREFEVGDLGEGVAERVDGRLEQLLAMGGRGRGRITDVTVAGRSRSTASRSRPSRRTARAGLPASDSGTLRVALDMSTRSCARCSIIDVSSVPPWMPMPSSDAGEEPPWSGGTPGWARNVIRPWCSRISRFATPTSAEFPP